MRVIHCQLCFVTTDARLEVYGSTANGFGTYQSDIDISMVLTGQDSMQVCKCRVCLPEQIRSYFRNNKKTCIFVTKTCILKLSTYFKSNLFNSVCKMVF